MSQPSSKVRSSFSETPSFRVDEDTGDFIVESSFEYVLGWLGSELPLRIPAGSRTDFASIPWLLQWYIKPTDPRIFKEAVLHDVGYRNQMGFMFSNILMRRALKDRGQCEPWLREVMFWLLVFTGWPAYLKAGRKLKIRREQLAAENKDHESLELELAPADDPPKND